MRIYNVNIHPVEQPEISHGYVAFSDGKITEVGTVAAGFVPAPEDIDGDGMELYPGLVDAHTHLGMWEDGLGFEGDDGNEDTDPCTPQLRAIDAVNPMDDCFAEVAAAGVTTVITGPGSANAIGGQLTAIKTVGRRIDDMVIDPFCAMKFALGENPKTVYHGKNQAPVTRMATAALIREQLQKAKRYADDLALSEADEERDKPEYDAKCEALLPVVRGQKPAHFHAHRADDIFTAVRIAQEFSLRYVIVHGTAGGQIAEELAALQVPVLCGPVLCDRSKPELKQLSPKTAGVLASAGVATAIITDHPVIPAQYLSLCAALCVREGMDRASALRAITLTPAQICGIDHRVGSIMPGKDADFLLLRGDLFDVMNKPQMVFVNGRRIL